MQTNPYIDKDLQELAEAVRRFANERVKPGFLARDITRDLDRNLLKEMGDLGFICPELQEEFGGLGMSCVAAVIDLQDPRARFECKPAKHWNHKIEIHQLSFATGLVTDL